MAHVEVQSTEALFVSSGAAEIFYRDYSPSIATKHITLVCLHAFIRNSRDFHELGLALASSGTRVLAPDLRGRGFSSRYPDVNAYRYENLLQDVWDLLGYLGLKQVVVLGSALGGIMALDMAANSPERIMGVVLNDLGAEIGEAALKRMSVKGYVEAADYSFEEAVGRMKQQFAEAYPGLTDPQWIGLMHRAYREVTPGRFSRDLDVLALADGARMYRERPTFWKEFGATRELPVALLRGENSDYFTVDTAQRMLKYHPNAILTTVKDRGHPPLLDEPESLHAIRVLLSRAQRRAEAAQ